MKTMIHSALIFGLSIYCVSAYSQNQAARHFTAGIALQAGLPGGSAEKNMTGTIGVDIRLAYPAGPGFVTLTGGATGFAGPTRDNANAKSANGDYTGAVLFTKAGYKYFLDKRFFVMGEAGLGRYFMSHENDGRTTNFRGTGVVVSPSAGIQFGKFEMALRYELFPVNGGTVTNTSLRFGVTF